MAKNIMLFRGLRGAPAQRLHHNISHRGDLLRHVGRPEPCFHFRAKRWLFEACTCHTVTLEMVHLIPVTLSPAPAALRLPLAASGSL